MSEVIVLNYEYKVNKPKHELEHNIATEIFNNLGIDCVHRVEKILNRYRIASRINHLNIKAGTFKKFSVRVNKVEGYTKIFRLQ